MRLDDEEDGELRWADECRWFEGFGEMSAPEEFNRRWRVGVDVESVFREVDAVEADGGGDGRGLESIVLLNIPLAIATTNENIFIGKSLWT